jgi:hypothetical protein
MENGHNQENAARPSAQLTASTTRSTAMCLEGRNVIPEGIDRDGMVG